jgi:hypothetical protein
MKKAMTVVSRVMMEFSIYRKNRELSVCFSMSMVSRMKSNSDK